MSATLGAERSREQVQELFYPGQSGKPVSDASQRNPEQLRAFDHRGYWEVYERILRTPALRFPDIHRITGLSQGQGRVLLQVVSHVVDCLTSERTKITNSRHNDKPPLRKDLEPALDYYTPARLRQAEKRLKVFFPPTTPPQSSLESASVLLQQEVLEFVLEHLAAFNAPKMRDYLQDGDPDSDLYAARFREGTWAGVLKIVRWHVGDCRPKWLPVEGSHKPPEAEPSTQAASLTDALCNYDAGLSAVREKLHSKLQSSVFRSAFAAWLSEQCGGEPGGEEMQSADGAWGSKGSHADDDGSTVVLAAAAAAKAPGVGRPVDPKPAAKEAAKPTAKPDATRDAPLPEVDDPRCMAEGRLPDRNGRRKALTDNAQRNGTEAPASNKQGKQPVLDLTREVQRQEHNTATPRRRAERPGWVEPSPVRTSLSSKPGRTLPCVRGSVTPGRALVKGPEIPLAGL